MLKIPTIPIRYMTGDRCISGGGNRLILSRNNERTKTQRCCHIVGLNSIMFTFNCISSENVSENSIMYVTNIIFKKKTEFSNETFVNNQFEI